MGFTEARILAAHTPRLYAANILASTELMIFIYGLLVCTCGSVHPISNVGGGCFSVCTAIMPKHVPDEILAGVWTPKINNDYEISQWHFYQLRKERKVVSSVSSGRPSAVGKLKPGIAAIKQANAKQIISVRTTSRCRPIRNQSEINHEPIVNQP